MNYSSKASLETVNISGYPAYSMPAKQKLVSQVLTSFVNEPKFYGDNTASLAASIDDMLRRDPLFVAKLAAYARNDFHMRSVSHLLCAKLAHEVKGEEYVRKAISACIERGDDITEILSAYIGMYGKPIPNSLRRACRDGIERLGARGISRYQAPRDKMKMADAIKLCHPRPEIIQGQDALQACIEGRLVAPKSWESELSKKGNSKCVWENLIEENRIGYMAALRNLVSMSRTKPKNFGKILAKIADPEQVANSKQLPYRFYSAYRALKDAGINTPAVLMAVEEAIEASVRNCPRLPGSTAIFVDVSGSMASHMSNKSTIAASDVAALFAIMCAKLSDHACIWTFSTYAERIYIQDDGPILGQMSKINGIGGYTDMSPAFEKLQKSGEIVDRIIVLSDNEINRMSYLRDYWDDRHKSMQTYADEYRKKTGRDVWVHGIDLMGYGTVQFTGRKTSMLAGWSDKVIQLISASEQEESGALIKAIEAKVL